MPARRQAPSAAAGATAEPAHRPLLAALWMMGAIGSFSVMAIAGREAQSQLDTFETMMYRSAIGVLIVAGVAAATGNWTRIRARRMGLHFVRNLSHFTGQNLWFFAITVLPLAQVIAIEFSSPIWVVLAAPLFLGERLTSIRALATALGFAGILIAAQPDFSKIDPGILAAAAAAIGFAGSVIFTKLLTRTEAVISILFWLTVMQFFFGILCAGFDGDIALPSGRTIPFIIAIGITGLSAHFCLTTAISLAPATVVIPFDFLRLPVIAILGAVIYGERLALSVAVGAVIIFGANYLNTWVETRARSRRVARLHSP